MKLLKGQAAMEYLTTYGWALLLVVLVMVALVWLGVFNIGGQVKDQCTFPVGTFSCDDYLLAKRSGDVAPGPKRLEVTNNFGRDVYVCGITCSAQKTDEGTGFPAKYSGGSLAGASGIVDACAPPSSSGHRVGNSAHALLYSNFQAASAAYSYEPCLDAGGAQAEKTIGSAYTGKLYVFYSFDGETTGPARLAVGNLIARAQPA